MVLSDWDCPPVEEPDRLARQIARTCLRRLAAGHPSARSQELARLAQPDLPGWSVKELYELLTRDDS